jgi:hypothetical protein
MRATMDGAVRAELAAQFVGLACEIDQLLLFAGRPPGADTTLRIDVHAKRQLVGHLGRRVAVTLDGLDEPLVILTRHGTRVTQLIPLFQAIRSNVEVALSVLVESDAHLRVRVHRNPPEVNLIVENTYRRGAAPRFSTGLGQSLIKRRAVRLGGDAAFEPDAEPWFDVTDGVAAYRTTVTLRLAREE